MAGINHMDFIDFLTIYKILFCDPCHTWKLNMAKKSKHLKTIVLAALILLLLLLILLLTQCSDTADNADKNVAANPVSAGTEQVPSSGNYISKQQTGSVFAQLSQTGERYNANLTWRAYKVNSEGKAVGPEIVKFIGNPFRLYLKPGKYVVKTSISKAVSGESLVEIKKEIPSEVVVNLKAGFVVLSGKTSKTSDPIKRDIQWSVLRYVDSGVLRVANATNENHKFLLNEGRYRLNAKFGNTEHQQDFAIKANATTNITPNFMTGVLMLNGVLDETSDPITRDIEWNLYKLNDDGTAKKPSNAAAIDERARLTLSEGRYRLVAKYGAAEVTTPVTVQAGKETRQTINFKAGIVNVSGTRAETNTEITKSTVWYVYAIDETGTARRSSMAAAINETASFILPAGTYKIDASLYNDSSVRGSGEITVTEGKTHSLTLALSKKQ